MNIQLSFHGQHLHISPFFLGPNSFEALESRHFCCRVFRGPGPNWGRQIVAGLADVLALRSVAVVLELWRLAQLQMVKASDFLAARSTRIFNQNISMGHLYHGYVK